MLATRTRIRPSHWMRSTPLIALATALVLAATLSLAAAGRALAHGGAHAAIPAGAAHGDVALRDCWMTAALVPRPADTVEESFRAPLDLTQTFYGTDPLVGIWGIACDRARVADERVERVIVSLVGVPIGLTAAGVPPLANNFAHALLRVDTDSRPLAKALRRAGLPARFASDARFRHSSPQAVPSTGELVVPGKYRIEVAAEDIDPTNPHDHVNEFGYLGRDGRTATLGLLTEGAFDRFCFPALGNCAASVRAHRRSPLRDLLGDGSAPVTGGFDHTKIDRIDLPVDGRAG